MKAGDKFGTWMVVGDAICPGDSDPMYVDLKCSGCGVERLIPTTTIHNNKLRDCKCGGKKMRKRQNGRRMLFELSQVHASLLDQLCARTKLSRVDTLKQCLARVARQCNLNVPREYVGKHGKVFPVEQIRIDFREI